MKRYIITLILLLLLALPVMAQDATAEPVATQEAAAIVTPDTTTSNDSDVTLSVWQIITGVAGAFALGGVVGVAGAGVLASRLRNDPATMSAIEKLGNSVPEPTAKLIIDLAKSGQEIAELLKEALDRVPAASKTEPAKSAG